MTKVFVMGPDGPVELETKKEKPMFPKPLSEWLSENRFEFERVANIAGEPKREYSNIITPIAIINYVDSNGLITALARYEKYVDDHFKL